MHKMYHPTPNHIGTTVITILTDEEIAYRFQKLEPSCYRATPIGYEACPVDHKPAVTHSPVPRPTTSSPGA